MAWRQDGGLQRPAVPLSALTVLRLPLALERSWKRLSAGRSPLLPQRLRSTVAAALALGVWLLRPLPLLRQLPGWVVGMLLLWALVELAWLAWWPRRWR
jgi:hypothetical protein